MRRDPDPLARLVQPVSRVLRQGSALTVLSGLVWPAQAALVATAFGRLVAGQPVGIGGLAAAYVVLGLVRAWLGMAADRKAQAAAETLTAGLRAEIVAGEAARSGAGAAGGAGAVAALAAEKLEALVPWLTRYAPARLRVAVLPPVILALSLWFSWAAGLVLLISGPLIPVFMALVGLAARETSERQMARIGSLNDLLVDRLSALADIRLLGAGDAVARDFATQAGGLRRDTMAVLRLAFLSSTVLELFAAVGVAMMAVWVGFSLLGVVSFGTWGAPLAPEAGIFLLLLAPDFYQPMRDLAAAWHDKAAAEAVAAELAARAATQTPSLPGRGERVAPLAGPASITLAGCRAAHGLRLPDMAIAPGEAVALVGPSGAGKTTVLRLMAGLSLPCDGEVRVAGQTLTSDNADAWRARIGWMPQSVHFLNASLRANLTLGRAGDVAAALAGSAAAGVVTRLPGGLTARLGETGGGLSGGEARRMTLARALHGAPDVILADEPTADLDAGTAGAVAEGLLAANRRGATLVVATHDRNLAARMDRIIRLEGTA
ncbi:ATP-binding cassette domain-containing protein [Ruixingdingia sedimenti]|uniref:ATP-binding cassette domain-containing protein n=1 Tax=Ruixingdingia sedimenti TaxID=3073604 RepID=A0ABU1F5X0_9RHOB|nr:ATP-binding cassette domain-containing protein [Xinfangfangia sp. LG-4]MDR5652271.1 ATP-binding cassette domain-containing protein [Xinfangfangia sp. LG-4]